jgi:hypothetical protein
MRRRTAVALAVALLLAGVVLHSLLSYASDDSAYFQFKFPESCDPDMHGYFFLLFLAVVKKTDVNASKLSIFKGREAKLNRAIFLTLFQSGPLIVYDITKEVKKRKGFRRTRYTNVNRRVRALAQQGYLVAVGSREIQSGAQGTLYQVTARTEAAFYLTAINQDLFIKEATEEALITEMAAIALFLGMLKSEK